MTSPWLWMDVAAVLSAGWVGSRGLVAQGGLVEKWLGWLVMSLAIAAGIGVLAGAAGFFGANAFSVSVYSVCLVLGIARRKRLRGDFSEWRQLVRATSKAWGEERGTRIPSVLLVGFLLVTWLLALGSEPVVYDALTYRLSRVGHWLQEGRIGYIATNDPRQNYMPVVPDVVMSWLCARNPAGFRGAGLAQWYGGVMLLVATIGLARQHGLRRSAALGAGAICLWAGNVAPQFTTAHTDLFTAGLVAASFCLWQLAADRREGSVLAGLAAGLALGSKGTVFYFAPILLVWALWWWRIKGGTWSLWAVSLGSATLAGLLFAGPGLASNQRHFGTIFGPADFIALHHKGGGVSLPRKLMLNLASSGVQVLEPHSQPPGMRDAAARMGGALAQALPEADAFAYDDLNRRETLGAILERRVPDADATSFGVILLVMFLLGTGRAVTRRGRPGAKAILMSAGGVGAFLVFFHGMQQWHPYGFRYFSLVGPWMAVVAAWGIEQTTGRARSWTWTAVMAAAAWVAAHVLLGAHQAGWPAFAQPERSRGYFIYQSWQDWAGALDKEPERLRVALPFNLPISAFYAVTGRPEVSPEGGMDFSSLTAAQAVERARSGGEWLVTPAAQFLGREGTVAGRLWLFRGDPFSPFSLAAWRPLATGEKMEPLLYRHIVSTQETSEQHLLLLRPGGHEATILRLHGRTGADAVVVVVRTPGVVRSVPLVNGRAEIAITLTPDQVSEVVIEIPARMGASGSPTLEVELGRAN